MFLVMLCIPSCRVLQALYHLFVVKFMDVVDHFVLLCIEGQGSKMQDNETRNAVAKASIPTDVIPKGCRSGFDSRVVLSTLII